MIITHVYACDWPGCSAEVTINHRTGDLLSDQTWEGRGYVGGIARWHACPEHRFKSTEEFSEAIEPRTKEDLIDELVELGREVARLRAVVDRSSFPG